MNKWLVVSKRFCYVTYSCIAVKQNIHRDMGKGCTPEMSMKSQTIDVDCALQGEVRVDCCDFMDISGVPCPLFHVFFRPFCRADQTACTLKFLR